MKALGIFAVVAVISIVQMYVAGPLGLSLELDPRLVVLASFIGGMVGVVFIVWSGPALIDRGTAFLRRLFRRPAQEQSDDENDEPGRFAQLLDRFGAPFLGIAGPLTIGGWAAAALGVSQEIPKVKLIGWLAVGQLLVTVTYVSTIAGLTN